MPLVLLSLLMCVYSLMLLCTHLSEFLMNKDVYYGTRRAASTASARALGRLRANDQMLTNI